MWTRVRSRQRTFTHIYGSSTQDKTIVITEPVSEPTQKEVDCSMLKRELWHLKPWQLLDVGVSSMRTSEGFLTESAPARIDFHGNKPRARVSESCG